MRLLLTLLLAVLIPFNAAFAAATAICDAGEKNTSHGWHMGHHEHEHGHDANVTQDNTQPVDETHHTHAHPCFSLLFPALTKHEVPSGDEVQHPVASGALVSVPPSRLERPPRIASVA